jgi:membrane-bound lytic murein transglycosylase F
MLQKSKYYLLLFLIFSACDFHRGRENITIGEEDFKNIRDKGKITVITDYSSTDYFIYRGQPMGFQYELLQQLANHLGVKLEVRVSRSLDESFEWLRNGKADLIAQNLTITRNRQNFVSFTHPLLQSKQVLVQRVTTDPRQAGLNDHAYAPIRNVLDLAGKTVYVVKGSAYVKRLQNLSEEIGAEINIIEVDESVEQLIYLVSTGEIPLTVSDELMAKVNNRYYPELDVSLAVGFEQNLAWAVRKSSVSLLSELNDWISNFTQTQKYRQIYARYFENNKSATIVESDFYAINTGKISPYDEYIRQYSEKVGWDWRLLASLIYQESRFKADVTSWAGAWGLMQLMPATAKRYGVVPESPARDQIRAGTQFIQWLNNQYKDIKDQDERIKFILAAYNIGPGHVDDARKLASKNGADPNKWDENVADFLLSKSDPRYYNDPVVKYGYCRGTETFRYVTEVLERYEHYKNIVGN